MLTAPVNKIIPFSNVDGPGNRCAVFFQGCPFDCQFCHNPETIHLCVGCGRCVKICPAGALSISADGKVLWNKADCVQCDSCLKVCPHGASPKVRLMRVEDVMTEIRRCAPYIDGVTTSGGECTLYNEFLIRLFTEVKTLGKTCLIDSNGSFDFERDPRVLAVSEGVMLDVKAVHPLWSRELTGQGPELVLKNLRYLLSAEKLYEVRTILFPGRDAENEETVRTVAGLIPADLRYKLIRYRPYGVRERYKRQLGEEETDLSYAERFVELAHALGAKGAFVL